MLHSTLQDPSYVHHSTEWLLWVWDCSVIFSFFQLHNVVSAQWWAARYVLGTVLTIIHMISSMVFCLLMALDNFLSLSALSLLWLYHFLLRRCIWKKPCVPLSPLGRAFETHRILELTLLRGAVGQSGGGKQACTKHFCCLAVGLQATLTYFLVR